MSYNMTLEEIANYELGIKFLRNHTCSNWLNVIIENNPGVVNVEELKIHLTPQQSLELLRTTNINCNQRDISSRHLKSLIQSMMDSTYSSAVNLITFIHIIKENRTELLDGQHTLRASSDANVSIIVNIRIITVVCREDAQILMLAIGDGKDRNLADKLAIIGTPEYLGLNRTATTKCGSAIGYILGKLKNRTIDNLARRVSGLVCLKSIFVETVEFIAFYKNNYSTKLRKNASFLAVSVVLMKENEELAKRFIRGILDTDIPLRSDNDPRLYIRDFLINRNAADGLNKGGGMSLFLNAWNDYRNGKSWNNWIDHTDYPKQIVGIDLRNLIEQLNSHFKKNGPEFI